MTRSGTRRSVALAVVILGALLVSCANNGAGGASGGAGGTSSGGGGGTSAAVSSGGSGAGGSASGGSSASAGGTGGIGSPTGGSGDAAAGGSQAGGTSVPPSGGSGGWSQADGAASDGAASDGAGKDAPLATGGAGGADAALESGAGTGGAGGKDAGTGGNRTGGATSTGGVASSGGTKGTGGTTSSTGTGGTPNLWEKYRDFFPIGAAVDNTNYNSSLLTKHFNSIVAENDMKFDQLQPNENQFNYATADQMVSFATGKGMKVRGHTLVWHRQTPAWVFANATKDVLLSRMRNHISNVMKHFKGKVYAWDVVNEAMMEDGDYRKGDESKEDQRSQWYQIAGADYIAEAFKAAAAADPDAKLFYNDYYDWLPAKNQGIHKMLKGLLDAGVPVHGVGMQCHINIEPSTDPNNQAYYQTVAYLEEAIKLYSSLGLEVQVTELDQSLYIPGVTYTSDQYYTTATFTPALQQQQADRYREFFALFRKYKDVITGVTFWGISDDNTWLSEFSSGRKDFPLLFDANKQPKPAFYAVVDF
jgi:endo-1,4-beta-xylanase